MEYDFIKNDRKDQKCEGTLKCRMMEPALAAFFGETEPTKKEVPVEFLVHNTWCFLAHHNKDQYITLTKIGDVELEYEVPYTTQDSDIDLWQTVDEEGITFNIVLGIDGFYIKDITKIPKE